MILTSLGIFHIHGLPACLTAVPPVCSLPVTTLQLLQSPDVASWGGWCFSRVKVESSNLRLTLKSVSHAIIDSFSFCSRFNTDGLLLNAIHIWPICGHWLTNLTIKLVLFVFDLQSKVFFSAFLHVCSTFLSFYVVFFIPLHESHFFHSYRPYVVTAAVLVQQSSNSIHTIWVTNTVVPPWPGRFIDIAKMYIVFRKTQRKQHLFL